MSNCPVYKNLFKKKALLQRRFRFLERRINKVINKNAKTFWMKDEEKCFNMPHITNNKL